MRSAVIVLLFGLFPALSASAQATNPIPSGKNASPAAWKALCQKLIKSGIYNENAGAIVLTSITPSDVSQTHQANYLLTDQLVVEADNTVMPADVIALSETWVKTPDGKWDIMQWKDTLDESGKLVSASSLHIVELTDGTILSEDFGPFVNPDDPAQIARWNGLLQNWVAAVSIMASAPQPPASH